MRYAPRHAISSTRRTARWATTGLATAALTVGGGIAATGTAHADDSVWDRVAACESGGNWSISTGNGYHGGLQFTPSTWRAYGGSGSAAGASKSEQIRVAKRVLAGQGPGAWPVCSRKAGLTRGSGGADSSSATQARASRSTERKAVSSSEPRSTKRSTSSTKVAEQAAPKRATKRASSQTSVSSYPGAGAFVLGHQDSAVTLLGKRLQAHGFGSFYKVGAGPTFTSADKAAVAAFQKSLGWTGSDVSGYPGPVTWAKLMAPAS
ncbi:transglycosylase family protein [Arsenicicoccus cauae]|uniref:transglycosylase family protein n=1 Tax=Arsenicicoccus cauae TaxID=2663847 RepID=UPI0018A72DA1|nr:transglycosylase family protein [Arsenicicoccus cauae]